VLAERAAASALAELHRMGVEPIGNPLEVLVELAAEARTWQKALRVQVSALESLSQTTPAGVEQIRQVVVLYERSLDRAAEFAAMLSKLNVEDRLVRLNARIGEAIGQQVFGVFERSLRAMNLSEAQWQIAREVFPRELAALADDAA